MRRVGLLKVGILLLMLGGTFAGSPKAQTGGVLDADGDGIPDAFDNCLLVPQTGATFADTNVDGFGNVCDPDFNDDLLVSPADLVILAQNFGLAAPPAGAVTDIDIDVDGVTGIPDAIVLRAYLVGGLPGPSGLPCAGTPGCQ